MTQDPWQRAHQIKRLRDQQAQGSHRAGGRGRQPAAHRPRAGNANPLRWVLAWIVVMVILLGGIAAWYWMPLWLPSARKAAQQQPEPVRRAVEALPEPKVTPDTSAMDAGYGFGLRLGGDYLQLLAQMRGQDPGWKVVETGGSNARLAAPGAEVKVIDGQIQNYELRLDEIFSAEPWQPWLQGFRDARLTPELSYTSLEGVEDGGFGNAEHELAGRPQRRGEQWVRPVYILRFRDGYLSSIEMALHFGLDISPLPPPETAAPDDSANDPGTVPDVRGEEVQAGRGG